MTTCSRLGVILTNVQALGVADVRHALPPVDWITVECAALLVGVSRKTIRNELSEHKSRFDPPSYQPYQGWPRRVITPRDLQTLRDMHPILSSSR